MVACSYVGRYVVSYMEDQMKIYCYNEPVYANNDIVGSKVLEVTDQQILYEYWNYWEGKMVKKFGNDSELITHDNCISDWVVVNWAWEKKHES